MQYMALMLAERSDELLKFTWTYMHIAVMTPAHMQARK
jgi:hypothetical protein